MTQIRVLIFKFLYFLGIGKLLLNKNRNNFRVPVLVFHKIIPEFDNVWPGIHPKLFEEIIVMLKQHYKVLPINALLTSPINELKNACFITFDDGYKDYLKYAYPIMKKHKVHSTLFALPPNTENMGRIWTSTVSFFVKHYSLEEIISFFNSHRCEIQYNEKSKFKLNLSITKRLCELPQNERLMLVDELRNKFKADEKILHEELLSMDELKNMDAELISVASHGLTHPCFKNENDLNLIEKELKESKIILEKELDRKVISFALPFGKNNILARKHAKKYYDMCFTGIGRPVDINKLKVDPEYAYDLYRYNIHHSSAEEVFFLINGFHAGLSSY